MKNILRRWLSLSEPPSLVDAINDHGGAIDAMLDILAIHGDRLEAHRAILADLERRLSKLEAYF